MREVSREGYWVNVKEVVLCKEGENNILRTLLGIRGQLGWYNKSGGVSDEAVEQEQMVDQQVYLQDQSDRNFHGKLHDDKYKFNYDENHSIYRLCDQVHIQ